MSVEELELYCKQAYEEVNSGIRSRAEQACLSIAESNNCYEMCRLLLDRANSHYSQIVAISSLTKLVNRSQSQLTIDERIEMRNMCVNYLMQKEDLADFVVKGIIGLISRITKLGWLDSPKEDEYPFREIMEPLMQMLKSGQARPMLLGVQILYSIVYEFNQSYEGEITRSTVMIRKIANNFRETQLFTVFLTSLDLLGRMSSNIKSLNLYDNVQHSIVQYSLKLTLACLTYDFIGTSGGEEVCDDIVSVQVPTSWRQAFLSPIDNPDPVPLFFELFKNFPPILSQLALSCIVQTASFRRSFFNNNERQTFLSQLVLGVCESLSTGSLGPEDESGCYHEMCRLLCRLKSNFQLSELVSLSEYARFIELLAQFTVRCCMHEATASAGGGTRSSGSPAGNSQHYLLLTWQRLVASLPYLRCTSQPHLLDVHCPLVLDAYLRSKLRSCASVRTPGSGIDGSGLGSGGDLEDGSSNVPQELEAVSVLARCQYVRTVNLLASVFDEVVGRSGGEVLVQLRELCWLVLLMGASVSGRVNGVCSSSSSTGGSGSPTDDSDRLDGELVGRVLQLVVRGCLASTLQQLHSQGPPPAAIVAAMAALEVAVLHFLDQLRRVYLCGETGLRSARLYEALQSRVSVSDDTALLDTIVRKVLDNLRVWAGASRAVLHVSLGLLHELSLGAIAKRVVRLPLVQELLQQHQQQQEQQFAFLAATPADPAQVAFGAGSLGSNPRTSLLATSAAVQLSLSSSASSAGGSGSCTGGSSNPRTCFYACLTRLFLLSPHVTEDPGLLLLREFLAPLTRTSDSLARALLSPATSPTPATKLALLGLIRDVRGVALACHSKTTFQALFDWLFPAVFSHLLVAVEVWGSADEWGVTLGSLRLVAELCLSRNNRLQPVQSAAPSGELVFRAAAAVLGSYSRRLSPHTTITNGNTGGGSGASSKTAPSSTAYLELVRECTATLDITRHLLTGNYANLYSASDALDQCLHAFLAVMIALPPNDLLAYPKLARAYYALADSVSQDHLMWLGQRQPHLILYFVSTIADGLSSTAMSVSSSCCSSLDNLATFLLRLLSSSPGEQPSTSNGGPVKSCVVSGSSELGPQFPPVASLPASLGLCHDARVALDGFQVAAQLLASREAESRDRWRLLVTSPDSRLMVTLARCMETLLHALMQPECKNQWAMSRPLLGIILLDTKAFEQLQDALISQREGSGASAECLKTSFQRLMEDVNCSLTIRNRDKFTQNLNSFRHLLSGPSQSSGAKQSMEQSSVDMVA